MQVRLITMIVASAAVFGLATGCGSDDEKAGEKKSSSTETTKTAEPRGPISATAIGPVPLGAGEDKVRELFGSPDKTEDVNFSGKNPPPQVDWVWKYEDGELRIAFATRNDTVARFGSTTKEFETKDGFRVGGDYNEVREKFGDQLRSGFLGEGTGTYIVSEGKPGSYPALQFAQSKDRIVEIAGGGIPPAGD